ncbi:hypothetical protein ACI6PS_07855 [Flavobacterium sp. PLA-1-15]|uniref:hypothetical protein n=1 Tax=Flavobacterium sp. PLA-1-15 TaxID=3380533 RepID=UPI003B7B634E
MGLNKKNKLLLVGFIFMLFIGYRFAIAKTLFYYRDHAAKSQTINQESITPEMVNKLLQKEKQLDAMLLQYSINPSASFQNDLLEKLSGYCASHNLKITDFKEPHSFTVNEFQTNSYQFTLKGSFNGSLSVINKIENSPSLGIIKHLNFSKNRDYKTNSDYLTATVILQKNSALP